jgi:hypothetical protein
MFSGAPGDQAPGRSGCSRSIRNRKITPGALGKYFAATQNHYIKTASPDAIAAMKLFSEALLCSTCVFQMGTSRLRVLFSRNRQVPTYE